MYNDEQKAANHTGFCSLIQRAATPIMPCCGEKYTRRLGNKKRKKENLDMILALLDKTFPLFPEFTHHKRRWD